MVDVVVLGSGSPLPDRSRAGPGLAVVAGRDWLLVDCGRAVTQRAIDADLDPTAIAAVAITHHHSDHMSDLATLATTRWTAGATAPLVVVAPEGPAARHARRCLDPFDDQAFHGQAPPEAGARPAIEVRGFAAGAAPAVVAARDGWRLSSVLVEHRPVEPAVAFLVEQGGRRVVVSGDTAACDAVGALARGADVLVHQALRTDRVPRDLLGWNAGARAVGELAARARPRTLVLTHLIPAPVTPADERAYLDEVRAGGFDGPTTVAHDLLRLPA